MFYETWQSEMGIKPKTSSFDIWFYTLNLHHPHMSSYKSCHIHNHEIELVKQNLHTPRIFSMSQDYSVSLLFYYMLLRRFTVCVAGKAFDGQFTSWGSPFSQAFNHCIYKYWLLLPIEREGQANRSLGKTVFCSLWSLFNTWLMFRASLCGELYRICLRE
jgi:hypothetical protein